RGFRQSPASAKRVRLRRRKRRVCPIYPHVLKKTKLSAITPPFQANSAGRASPEDEASNRITQPLPFYDEASAGRPPTAPIAYATAFFITLEKPASSTARAGVQKCGSGASPS